MELFEEHYPQGNQQLEDVEITTTLLYFSKQESKEFKKLAKQGIKKLYGTEYQQKGNLSDYLLHLLRKDNDPSKTNP